jgi:hypothetical protein
MFETQLFRKLFQQKTNFEKEDTPPMLFLWVKFSAIFLMLETRIFKRFIQKMYRSLKKY